MKLAPACMALLVGCAHTSNAPAPRPELSGLTVPMVASSERRLALTGEWNEEALSIELDPARLTNVLRGPCARRMQVHGAIRSRDELGGEARFPLGRVENASLQGKNLGSLEVALGDGTRCALVLGAPALRGLAVTLSFEQQLVSFSESQSAQVWREQKPEAVVLDIARAPRTDAPLIAVRAFQGERSLQGPFVISLWGRSSWVFEGIAASAGWRSGKAIFEGAAAPEGVESVSGFVWTTLETAPGFGLNAGSFGKEAGAPPGAAIGELGLDVWSRWTVTFDVGSNVLVLERPKHPPAAPAVEARLSEWMAERARALREVQQREPDDP